MRRVKTVLSFALFVYAALPGSGHAQTPIPTSVDAKCEDDAACNELFTGYVREALKGSKTHVYERDLKTARFLIVLSIAKHSEGGDLRGYAFAVVAFRITAQGQLELAKLSNTYRATDEVEAAVRREMVEYVLK